MVEPSVDPGAWRSEQQRVAPRLARVAAAVSAGGLHGKWRVLLLYLPSTLTRRYCDTTHIHTYGEEYFFLLYG